MKKYIIIIAVLLAICAGGFFAIAVPMLNESARKCQDYSAHLALLTGLMEPLDDYYQVNGFYPVSLNELKLEDFIFEDGATGAMLKDFKYVSDGNNCELSYFSEYDSSEKTIRLSQGKLAD